MLRRRLDHDVNGALECGPGVRRFIYLYWTIFAHAKPLG